MAEPVAPPAARFPAGPDPVPWWSEPRADLCPWRVGLEPPWCREPRGRPRGLPRRRLSCGSRLSGEWPGRPAPPGETVMGPATEPFAEPVTGLFVEPGGPADGGLPEAERTADPLTPRSEPSAAPRDVGSAMSPTMPPSAAGSLPPAAGSPLSSAMSPPAGPPYSQSAARPPLPPPAASPSALPPLTPPGGPSFSLSATSRAGPPLPPNAGPPYVPSAAPHYVPVGGAALTCRPPRRTMSGRPREPMGRRRCPRLTTGTSRCRQCGTPRTRDHHPIGAAGTTSRRRGHPGRARCLKDRSPR